jgi:hypothetical protein
MLLTQPTIRIVARCGFRPSGFTLRSARTRSPIPTNPNARGLLSILNELRAAGYRLSFRCRFRCIGTVYQRLYGQPEDRVEEDPLTPELRHQMAHKFTEGQLMSAQASVETASLIFARSILDDITSEACGPDIV